VFKGWIVLGSVCVWGGGGGGGGGGGMGVFDTCLSIGVQPTVCPI